MLQHDRQTLGAALPQADPRVAEEVSIRASAVVRALVEPVETDVEDDEDQRPWFQVTPHGVALAMSIGILEDSLRDERSARLPQIAMLVALAQWPSVPEQLALQVAFGRGLATEHLRHVTRIVDHAVELGIAVDDHVRQLVAKGALPDVHVGRCLRGETQRVPDRDRTIRGIALLRWSAAHAPEEMQPALLCAVAWLLWALGKRADAMAHLVRAAGIDRGHAMVPSLMLLFGERVPTWTAAARVDASPRHRGL
ncbi:hypothetical protein [Agrococcus sp. Marseille-Q4369]|uniref:hypothetical protein n=1 Tax=Agrococcus sp. Marseille-Q4369 TaxID=2810513 RepID=UPI001B8BFE7C|nr:hypothetical protein [Agrococcus sp. Marseille-Q4369]QUW19296.1 hypothetical protein JSQ78_02845 [Agrococcus sp. Marseille-Q4369]